MFTGIIEALGRIIAISGEGSNLRFLVESLISHEFKTDQSVSHDGVCLTVVKTEGKSHEVVVVDETLKRSNLGRKKIGDFINLERAMLMNARLDGHLVQGHVDDVAVVRKVKPNDGSWTFEFEYDKRHASLLVDKGSVSINGVSLTVVKPSRKKFSVAIIPYTMENTNFHLLQEGDEVNVEFDMIGKYVQRIMSARK